MCKLWTQSLVPSIPWGVWKKRPNKIFIWERQKVTFLRPPVEVQRYPYVYEGRGGRERTKSLFRSGLQRQIILPYFEHEGSYPLTLEVRERRDRKRTLLRFICLRETLIEDVRSSRGRKVGSRILDWGFSGSRPSIVSRYDSSKNLVSPFFFHWKFGNLPVVIKDSKFHSLD